MHEGHVSIDDVFSSSGPIKQDEKGEFLWKEKELKVRELE